MRQGTTPTAIYKLPEEINASEIEELRITIQQGSTKIEFSSAEVTSDNGLKIHLTQEQTKSLSAGGYAEMQLKFLYDGEAIATSIVKIPVSKILNTEVLTDED